MQALGLMPPSLNSEKLNKSVIVHRSPGSILSYELMMAAARKRIDRQNITFDENIGDQSITEVPLEDVNKIYKGLVKNLKLKNVLENLSEKTSLEKQRAIQRRGDINKKCKNISNKLSVSKEYTNELTSDNQNEKPRRNLTLDDISKETAAGTEPLFISKKITFQAQRGVNNNRKLFRDLIQGNERRMKKIKAGSIIVDDIQMPRSLQHEGNFKQEYDLPFERKNIISMINSSVLKCYVNLEPINKLINEKIAKLNQKVPGPLDSTINKLYTQIDQSKNIPERLTKALDSQFKTPNKKSVEFQNSSKHQNLPNKKRIQISEKPTKRYGIFHDSINALGIENKDQSSIIPPKIALKGEFDEFFKKKINLNNSFNNNMQTIRRDRQVTKEIRSKNWNRLIITFDNTPDLSKLRYDAEKKRQQLYQQSSSDVTLYENLKKILLGAQVTHEKNYEACKIIFENIKFRIEDGIKLHKTDFVNILNQLQSKEQIQIEQLEKQLLLEIINYLNIEPHDSSLKSFSKLNIIHNEQFLQINSKILYLSC